MYSWGISPMHTPSPQSMDRVMTQVQLSRDLAHMDDKALKTPLEAGQSACDVLSGDGWRHSTPPAFPLRVLYCFQPLRRGIRLPDIFINLLQD